MTLAVPISRLARLGLAVGLHVLMAGCAGLSGLDGSSSFKCAAPAGIPCQSVTGVHLNERSGNLPSQRPVRGLSGEGELAATEFQRPHGEAVAEAPRSWQQAAPRQPPLGAIRSDPTVIRIWLAPWEDTDGDLHDQAYVYLQLDAGRWLIEHNRERIRREFTPVRAAAAAVPTAVERARSEVDGRGGPNAEAQAAAIAEGRRRAQQAADTASAPVEAGTGVRP